ncbi:MAG: sporulation protein Cse60 [Bacillaceae bacterium]|nr:sporulation protein Cse60 [Bacillaceae bacterium]
MIQIKVFDEEHEKDLEDKVNYFLRGIADRDLVDIKYQISCLGEENDQIYCFSAMVIYRA